MMKKYFLFFFFILLTPFYGETRKKKKDNEEIERVNPPKKGHVGLTFTLAAVASAFVGVAVTLLFFWLYLCTGDYGKMFNQWRKDAQKKLIAFQKVKDKSIQFEDFTTFPRFKPMMP